MNFANLTYNAVNEALAKDNGKKYKQNLQAILPTLIDVYTTDDNPRGYLGASAIGEECSRKLWFKFRFVKKEKQPEPRLIRLFNRGHLEEARFLALLRTAGINVKYQAADLQQYSFSDLGGHFKGRCDGIAENVPECPNEVVLLEFKTMSDKYFNDLSKKGVRVSQPKYYSQIQAYLNGIGLNKCLFCSVNKNDDELYFEIVERNKEHYEELLNKAKNIIFNISAPRKINESPAWFLCKWCEYNDVCHLKAPVQKSCRLCSNCYTKLERGEHFCTFYSKEIPVNFQIKGCEKWTDKGE